MTDPADLVAAYDAQLRTNVPDPMPKGWSVERDGPLVRFLGMGDRAWVLYHDLGGLEGDALDELIARQVHYFRERRHRFEWKLHGHRRTPTRLFAEVDSKGERRARQCRAGSGTDVTPLTEASQEWITGLLRSRTRYESTTPYPT